jgi:hypothetical protein
MWCVRITTVAMEGHMYVLNIVCVCILALVTQHAKCMHCMIHQWPVWLYHIFPHYIMNSTTFGKKGYLTL